MRQKQVPSRAPNASAAAMEDPPCSAVRIKSEPVEMEQETADEAVDDLPVATRGEDSTVKMEPDCEEGTDKESRPRGDVNDGSKPPMTDRFAQPFPSTGESATSREGMERVENESRGVRSASQSESPGMKKDEAAAGNSLPTSFAPLSSFPRHGFSSGSAREGGMETGLAYDSASRLALQDRLAQPFSLTGNSTTVCESSERGERESLELSSASQPESSGMKLNKVAAGNGLPILPVFPFFPRYGVNSSFLREGGMGIGSGYDSIPRPPLIGGFTQPFCSTGKNPTNLEGSARKERESTEENSGMKKIEAAAGNSMPMFSVFPYFYGGSPSFFREGGMGVASGYDGASRPPLTDQLAQPFCLTGKSPTGHENSKREKSGSSEALSVGQSEISGMKKNEAAAANSLPAFHAPLFFPRFGLSSGSVREEGMGTGPVYDSGVFMVMQPEFSGESHVQFRGGMAGKGGIGTSMSTGHGLVETFASGHTSSGMAGENTLGETDPGSGKKPQCAECGKTFANSTILAKHVETVHRGQKNHVCPECGKIFGYKGSLKKHMESAHTGDKQYACVECSKMFGCKEYLIAHMKTVHRGEHKCECAECGKTFSHKSSLDKHIAAVHRGERFSCADCGEQFTRKATLNSHIEMIHRQVKHRCAECGESFGQRRHLRAHLEMVHQGSARFMCFDCNKNFSNKFTLEAHMQTVHRGERSFECPECKKLFTQNCHVQTHIRTVHMGEKNFECTQCDKKFSKNWKLKLHVESVHQGVRKYPCAECGKSFSSKAYVDIHVETIHRGQKNFKCEQCGSSFTQKSSLNMHVETVHNGQKKFECPECGRGFTHSSHMKVHLQAVHKGGATDVA